ncbi:MAG TPA: hypothetical protein VF092_09710 [Longimicrobium sp.]
MGIPLTVFTLHCFAGVSCAHYLLVRVEQPEYSNADEGDFLRAVLVADAKREALVRTYESGVLASECPASHEIGLIGELQSYPVGEELIDSPGGRFVDLWVAETRHGAPWVVMGTAADEDAFWREVDADEDLASLGPLRPAVRWRAFFVAESDRAVAHDE